MKYRMSRTWSSRALAAGCVAALVGVAGCASLQQALGISQSLEDEDLEKIEAELVGESAVCPGGETGLVVRAYVAGEEEAYVSEGIGDGRLGWESLDVEATGVELYESGTVTMTADHYEALETETRIEVASNYHDDEPVYVEVPTRFDCEFVADFSGPQGRDGAHGRSGSSGSNGNNEDSSGPDAAPGGRGGDGQDGGNGGHGEHGGDGHDVVAEVTLLEEADEPLLEVYAESRTSDATSVQLVDPEGGEITISARGGRGGHGGAGGSGGRGGSGGSGNPPGDGGHGGHGGDGGDGADGGDGGSVTVYIDPDAEPYVDAVAADTSGGSGGNRGAAGHGGSGGSADAGANSGNGGNAGRPGSRSGTDGADGPPPEFIVE